jgi:hypothetical protein
MRTYTFDATAIVNRYYEELGHPNFHYTEGDLMEASCDIIIHLRADVFKAERVMLHRILKIGQESTCGKLANRLLKSLHDGWFENVAQNIRDFTLSKGPWHYDDDGRARFIPMEELSYDLAEKQNKIATAMGWAAMDNDQDPASSGETPPPSLHSPSDSGDSSDDDNEDSGDSSHTSDEDE